jgi:protein-disulfide isomerase
MKKSYVFLLFLFTINVVFSQTLTPRKEGVPAQKEAAAGNPNSTARMPAKDDVEAAMKRTFGYDPSITWVIYDISPSVIPGLADVLVSIKQQSPQHIYYSADTQNAIAGEMIPFGLNPFAPIRAALQAADGPAQGSQTPAILMVEFSDLECPHCKAAQPIIEKLVTDFPQVRYIFQQFPLPATMHPWAMKAAEYADCVRQLNPGAFWKYVDTVFENQASIAAATAEDKLKELATAMSLDAQKISTCASLPQTEARIKKSVDLGRSLDVTQTPTLFLNGRRVLGIADIPYPQLKSLVQFEIDHAGK